MQQVHITDTILEEVFYFSEEDIEAYNQPELLKKPSMALLMKRSSENLPNNIDDVVAQMIYGNLRKAPGDEKSPYQKLLQTSNDVEMPGIWAPPNSQCKAMCLKWFFPTISGPYKLPEDKPIPPHLILAYDAFKYKEVMELSQQFPEAVIKYGFFTTDIPTSTHLIEKTVEKFEKRTTPPTYEEKIVIQLVKSDNWLEDFCELGPCYMSPDSVQGAEDAKMFFPPSYDIPEDIIMEIKKKPKKKMKKFVAVVEEAHEEQIMQDKAAETEENLDQVEVDESTEEKEELEAEEEDKEDEIMEIDKATSPMAEEEVNE